MDTNNKFPTIITACHLNTIEQKTGTIWLADGNSRWRRIDSCFPAASKQFAKNMAAKLNR